MIQSNMHLKEWCTKCVRYNYCGSCAVGPFAEWFVVQSERRPMSIGAWSDRTVHTGGVNSHASI